MMPLSHWMLSLVLTSMQLSTFAARLKQGAVLFCMFFYLSMERVVPFIYKLRKHFTLGNYVECFLLGFKL